MASNHWRQKEGETELERVREKEIIIIINNTHTNKTSWQD
jgi:hypothetical protein